MCVQGALLLSEVMREREAQLEYKKKKEEIAKAVDQKYIVIQQEVFLLLAILLDSFAVCFIRRETREWQLITRLL